MLTFITVVLTSVVNLKGQKKWLTPTANTWYPSANAIFITHEDPRQPTHDSNNSNDNTFNNSNNNSNNNNNINNKNSSNVKIDEKEDKEFASISTSSNTNLNLNSNVNSNSNSIPHYKSAISHSNKTQLIRE